MNLAAFVFVVMMKEVLSGGHGGKHHVHFKIHVPEIIKHHIHTKTVFIHVHSGGFDGGMKMEQPKKKESHKEENWSSWSSYGHSGHSDDHTGGELKGHGNGHLMMPQGGHEAHHQSLTQADIQPALQYQDIRSQFFGKLFSLSAKPADLHGHDGRTSHHGHGMSGYSYPPQYSVHEAVKEMPYNSIESYSEGHNHGLHSMTGHDISNELKNFYDNTHEELDDSVNGYQDESHEGQNENYYDDALKNVASDGQGSYQYAGDDDVFGGMAHSR